MKYFPQPIDLAIFVISPSLNADFIDPSFVAMWEIAKNPYNENTTKITIPTINPIIVKERLLAWPQPHKIPKNTSIGIIK